MLYFRLLFKKSDEDQEDEGLEEDESKKENENIMASRFETQLLKKHS